MPLFRLFANVISYKLLHKHIIGFPILLRTPKLSPVSVGLIDGIHDVKLFDVTLCVILIIPKRGLQFDRVGMMMQMVVLVFYMIFILVTVSHVAEYLIIIIIIRR